MLTLYTRLQLCKLVPNNSIREPFCSHALNHPLLTPHNLLQSWSCTGHAKNASSSIDHQEHFFQTSSTPIMMSMGYFQAPRQLIGRKHCSERELNGESLHAAAAAGEVPKGYFAVYVGAEARRFVVPTSYLRRPAFRELMERAAEELGFIHAGGIRIPCREEDFRPQSLRSRSGASGGGRARGATAAR